MDLVCVHYNDTVLKGASLGLNGINGSSALFLALNPSLTVQVATRAVLVESGLCSAYGGI